MSAAGHEAGDLPGESVTQVLPPFQPCTRVTGSRCSSTQDLQTLTSVVLWVCSLPRLPRTHLHRLRALLPQGPPSLAV